ncbi:MAG TPA: DUF3105 domain-containing protein [Gaiella sp.]|jgi:hypothetical protein|nr:DUF3105 domain-containing protein [Gaiella sp.]
MPPKPRPQGKPKPPSTGTDRRALLMLGIGGIAVLAIAAVALAFTLGGGSGGGDARAALEAAGCTLGATPALPGDHSVTSPTGTSKKWNTVPPTSGPHYAVPVVYGAYEEPVNEAQLVHNLEHGAIAVQYGSDVTDATVQQLRTFVQSHPRGTVLAPYPALGDEISLGAWVTKNASEPTKGTAYLAKCTTFDDKAFAAFFDAYQFQGPERFPPDSLLPGRS